MLQGHGGLTDLPQPQDDNGDISDRSDFGAIGALKKLQTIAIPSAAL
jgi:hypothetical protein